MRAVHKTRKDETVGITLRRLRTEAKFGLKSAGPKVGVSYTYLSKVENDQKTPSPGLVRQLCHLYGADADVENLLAKLGAVPDDVQEIVREYGKEAFDLLRRTYSGG